MEQSVSHESALRTYVWIAIMLAVILFKGFLAFFVVSDMGQPTWAFRPVADLPASSDYAVYRLLPTPQHVRGAKGE